MSAFRRRLAYALLALLIAAVLPGTSPPSPALAATDDDPTTLVTDDLNEWALGQGLLYWAEVCYDDELTAPGYLKRMPGGGGPQTALATTTDATCETFHAMVITAEGLYYYNDEVGAIEFRPTGNPFDPPTAVYTTSPGHAPGTNMAADGEYLYWLSAAAGPIEEVHRVKKDGTGHELLYSGGGTPSTLTLIAGFPVWAGTNGVAYLTPGTTLPWTRDSLSTTPGRYLDWYSTGFFTFDLYWTDIWASPRRIRRATCNQYYGVFPNPGGLDCDADTNFYSAPDASGSTWYIGQPRRMGSYLFWPEHLEEAGPYSDRVRRRPVAGGTTDEIASSLRQIDYGLAVDSLYVYFATEADDAGGLDAGIHRLPLNASAITRDLRADWFEVTQGIQNRGNTVPLTADKTTYVRGYGYEATGPDTPIVSAVLHGSRSGNPLPGSPLSPLNGTVGMVVGSGYERDNLDDSWLFALPPSWVAAGTTDFRLEVDPNHAYPDASPANNSASQSLALTAKGPVCTVFVPVRTNAPTPHTGDPNFSAWVDMAERLWPTRAYWPYRQNDDVAELEACWWGPFPYPCYGPYELPDDTWKVLLSLNTRDAFSDDPDECDDAGGYTHYVGMVHPATNTGDTNGAAYMDRSAAWVKMPPHSPTTSTEFDFPRKGGTLAHELGHNANRAHVNCGGPADPDLSYPYPVDQIANVGHESYYGFDVRTQTILAPDDVADLMGYCQPRWPSDWTWRALYNSLDPGASAAAVETPLAGAAGAAYASGAVAAGANTGPWRYAFVYPPRPIRSGLYSKGAGGAAQAPAADATYTLRVADAANATLATSPVTLLTVSDGPSGADVAFVASFAAPDPAASRLELLKDGAVLTSLVMGPAVPAVTVTQPGAGQTVSDTLTVQWTATDADTSDQLLFALQYTPDNGATWYSLATDFAGAPGETQTFTLASPAIPATAAANQGHVRVLASDGYNTGYGDSAGFTVTNRAPVAFLLSPTPGESFPAGKPVVVRGMGFDLEDGELTGASLTWKLLGVVMGTGEQMTGAALPPGVYPISLTAKDSDGAETVTTGQLVIDTLAVPFSTPPSLDGYCTDAAYAEAAEVVLWPYSAGDRASVRLLRSNDYLWACFSGLKPGTSTPGALAALLIDPDYSRGSAAQASDFAFAVGENGGVYTFKGTLVPPGPGGLLAQVAKLDERWSAELRIDKDVLGGWDKLVGLAAAHLYVTGGNDNYYWPNLMLPGVPDTWGRTALGDVPYLESLSPAEATAGAAAFTLTVNGQGFVDGSEVLWNGVALPTTFVGKTSLTAQVDAPQVAVAATISVTVRPSASSPLVSNTLFFAVTSGAPTITALSPDSAPVGGTGVSVTVTGSGFRNGDTVVCGYTSLATTFVDSGKLRITMPAGMLSNGHVMAVAVRSGGSDGGRMSNTMPFVVTLAGEENTILLPSVLKK